MSSGCGYSSQAWRLSRPTPAVDDVVEFLPEHVHTLEAGLAQVADLPVERDHVAHVVVVAELFLRGPVRPLVRGGRVPPVTRPQPRLLDHRVRGLDRVVVEEPAAGWQLP